MAGCDRVQLGEHRLLDLHPLRHGLDHEVNVAEGSIRGGALDPAKDLLDLSGALLGRDALLLDQLADLPLGHFARLVQARLHEILVDVLEDDREAGRGDRLGDLPAHGARPDDGGLEHEHQAGTAVGSSARRGSSVSRAMTRRWICEVPSYSCMIFASRNSFSTGYSLMKP